MSEYKDYGFDGDDIPHAHAYLVEPIIQLLAKEHNKTILDLGCGNGALVLKLLEKGFNIYGTDASESGIKIGSQLVPGRFALQDLSTDEIPEPFAELTVDTIISTEVIEHLYDPKKFVQFCKKILLANGGGELILSTPYHGYLKNLLLAITGKWDQHADPLWDGGHIKLWSRATLEKLLHNEGFQITKFVGCGRVPFIWKSMIIKAKIK